MKNKKQYTVRDLRKWLKDNGYQEGYDDIGKIIKDGNYGKKVHYRLNVKKDNIEDVLFDLFTWTASDSMWEYWNDIYNKIKAEEC